MINVTNNDKLVEIDSNLERFLEVLPDLMLSRAQQYVLMRHREIVGYYPSAIDAQIAGNTSFDDKIFSIQQIKEVAEELGHLTYALHSGKT